jgi:hypothetical protein
MGECNKNFNDKPLVPILYRNEYSSGSSFNFHKLVPKLDLVPVWSLLTRTRTGGSNQPNWVTAQHWCKYGSCKKCCQKPKKN